MCMHVRNSRALNHTCQCCTRRQQNQCAKTVCSGGMPFAQPSALLQVAAPARSVVATTAFPHPQKHPALCLKNTPESLGPGTYGVLWHGPRMNHQRQRRACKIRQNCTVDAGLPPRSPKLGSKNHPLPHTVWQPSHNSKRQAGSTCLLNSCTRQRLLQANMLLHVSTTTSSTLTAQAPSLCASQPGTTRSHHTIGLCP